MRRIVEGLLFWVLAAHVYQLGVLALRYAMSRVSLGRSHHVLDPSLIGRLCREMAP